MMANVFDLLGGEEGANLSIEELAAQAAPKPVPKAVAEPKAPRPTSAAGQGGGRSEGGPRGGGRGSSGRGHGASRTVDDNVAFDAETAPSVRGRSGHGSGRGGRGSRGPGGVRKREYDRHDGTGRGHETEKRHGQGAHNWGTETEDAAVDLEKVQDGEEANAEGGNNAEGGDASEVPVPEPEEVQMTLEEYEAILAEKRASLNTQREAAFKPDEKQFDGFKQFAKVEEDADDIGLGLSKNIKVIGTNKAGREKERKEKELLTPNFRVQSSEEARGVRGGRGGRSSRGGRDGGRREGGRSGLGRGVPGRGQGRGNGRGPSFDETAFPELSA